jgi:hypothetical protein
MTDQFEPYVSDGIAPGTKPAPEPRGAKIVRVDRFVADPLFDPWETYAVPDFPLSTLPLAVANFVTTQANLIGCDLSGIAMSAITTMGAAIDHQFGLKIMRHGSWWASPRLWVLLAGRPSEKKTPAINVAVRSLEEIQGDAYDGWERAVAEHKAAGLPEADEPARPARHVIGDITVEKLGEILSRQKRGLLVKRDELSGWIGSMERYAGRGGGASDRAFWLQAYDGGRYTIDRIGRGEKHIANLSVSLVGGIQPERLAEMHDLTTDGLLQRFIPVVLRAARFPVDAPSGETADAFARLIGRLVVAPAARLIMSDAALAAFEQLRHHIFNIEQASGGLAPGFQAFAGKLPGMAASIALILHMAANPQHGGTLQVEIETIEAVHRIVVDFILPHAFEFYRSVETTTDGDRLKRLASWILTSGKDRIVPSDLAHNVAGFRGLGLSEVAQRLSPLVATGWLSPIGNDPIARAWRSSQPSGRRWPTVSGSRKAGKLPWRR